MLSIQTDTPWNVVEQAEVCHGNLNF